MQDLKRVIQSYVAEAVASPENRFPCGDINWNFVDADVFMRLNPVNDTVNMYYNLFDEIAEEYV
jgi:hypothetical protein